MADTKVGKITHYFDKIGVAVVEVLGALKVGDSIKISGAGGSDWTMVVDSMQVEHEQVSEARKGETIGMKVAQPVNEGEEVYLV